jgi:hypothetical protein
MCDLGSNSEHKELFSQAMLCCCSRNYNLCVEREAKMIPHKRKGVNRERRDGDERERINKRLLACWVGKISLARKMGSTPKRNKKPVWLMSVPLIGLMARGVIREAITNCKDHEREREPEKGKRE